MNEVRMLDRLLEDKKRGARIAYICDHNTQYRILSLDGIIDALRAERILAALREPSEAVKQEIAELSETILIPQIALLSALDLAVAAAEQVVHDGEHHPNTLADLLREAADEIEGSVRHEYGWPDVHPARKLKFDRDMDIVTRLRSAAEQEVDA